MNDRSNHAERSTKQYSLARTTGAGLKELRNIEEKR